jgi:hypothetical protein
VWPGGNHHCVSLIVKLLRIGYSWLLLTKIEDFLLTDFLSLEVEIAVIATDYSLDGRVRFPAGTRFFSSSYHPNHLWGPPSFPSNRYPGLFLRE